jgi:DNA-directed RNA polymerase N-terminal
MLTIKTVPIAPLSRRICHSSQSVRCGKQSISTVQFPHKNYMTQHHSCQSNRGKKYRSPSYTTRYKSSSPAISDYHQHDIPDLDIDRFTQCSISQFLPQASTLSPQFDSVLPLHNPNTVNEQNIGNSSTNSRVNDGFIQEDYIRHDLRHSVSTDSSQHQVQQQQQPQQVTYQQQRSVPLMELLSNFNPEKPPKLEDYPTREAGLEAMQCWLECDSLEESVAKYQRVIDDARNRNDYNSLSFVERQIARWFVPLQEAIEQKRQAYLTKDVTVKDPSFQKFGPLLCALPSAKLAIIVAHQAIIQCATSSNHHEEKHYSATGARFVRLALSVGQSVEDELVVHKLLHKRSIEEAQGKASNNNIPDSFESNVSSMLADSKEESQAASALLDATDVTDSQNVTHKWSYTTTHLKEYLDEVSKYKPNEKKRRVIKTAIQKARNAVEKADSWTQIEKAKLGSALLQSKQ